MKHLDKNNGLATSLVVQWLRLHASNAGDLDSVPGQGTKIPHAAWCGQKINLKNKQVSGLYCFLLFIRLPFGL